MANENEILEEALQDENVMEEMELSEEEVAISDDDLENVAGGAGEKVKTVCPYHYQKQRRGHTCKYLGTVTHPMLPGSCKKYLCLTVSGTNQRYFYVKQKGNRKYYYNDQHEEMIL